MTAIPWYRRRRLLVVLLGIALCGLLAVALFRPSLPRRPFLSRATLYVRCPDAAGLAAGDQVRLGEYPLGSVAALALTGDRVTITCRLDGLPELYHPVSAVIRLTDDNRRVLVLTGGGSEGERLRDSDYIDGESGIMLPGDLAPLRP